MYRIGFAKTKKQKALGIPTSPPSFHSPFALLLALPLSLLFALGCAFALYAVPTTLRILHTSTAWHSPWSISS
jgi:hypothetical protein